MRSYLGVDRPIPEQYAIYLRNCLRLDFGQSFYEHRPVSEVFFERVPLTVKLMGVSLGVAITVGVSIGIIAAFHRNSFLDRLIMSVSFSAYAMPNFVLGIFLIFLFSLVLRMLPSSGSGGWQYYIMPVLTLSSSNAAILARMTRSSMLNVIGEDYIRTARAKGVPERLVIIKHCLRNAFIPVLTMIGFMLTGLIGGSVVVERVFAWPGAGRLIVDAVLKRDYPVLQMAVLVTSVTVVLVNALVDVGYALIDPRIRLE
jgi:peptide/nickel transport system permease protein